MAQPGFYDLDACPVESLVQLPFQHLVDLFATGPQRERLLVVGFMSPPLG